MTTNTIIPSLTGVYILYLCILVAMESPRHFAQSPLTARGSPCFPLLSAAHTQPHLTVLWVVDCTGDTGTGCHSNRRHGDATSSLEQCSCVSHNNHFIYY